MHQVRSACYRCGCKGHSQQQCRFKEAICDNCGKKGHIKSACKNKKRDLSRKPTGKKQGKFYETKWVTDSEEDKESDFALFNVQSESPPPIQIQLKVNNQPLSFEVDTGAALSLISEETKEKFFHQLPFIRPEWC